jgi:hypothetical protein
MEKNLTLKVQRTCGNCTMCCQGWLQGEVYGYKFYQGLPCHFISCNGCSIYENRPENPCKNYSCAWLSDEEGFFPEWFIPEQSKIICTWREWKPGSVYLDVEECGETINSKYLNWLFLKHFEKEINVSCKILGGTTYYGHSEFVEFMNKKF